MSVLNFRKSIALDLQSCADDRKQSMSLLSMVFVLFSASSCRVGAVEISMVVITEMLTRKQPLATPTRTAPLSKQRVVTMRRSRTVMRTAVIRM